MYCSNCGTFMSDGDKFCPNCGTSIDGQPSPAVVTDPEPAHAPRKKLSKKALIGILAGAAVIAALVIILIFVFSSRSGRTPESTVEDYFNTIIRKCDFEKGFEYAVPDQVKKRFLAENDLTEREYTSILQTSADQYRYYASKQMQSFQCKILYIEPMNRSEIQEADDWYHREYDTPYGYVEDGVTVSFAISYTDYDGDTESQRDSIAVLKITGDWYIALNSEYSPFDLLRFSRNVTSVDY